MCFSLHPLKSWSKNEQRMEFSDFWCVYRLGKASYLCSKRILTKNYCIMWDLKGVFVISSSVHRTASLTQCCLGNGQPPKMHSHSYDTAFLEKKSLKCHQHCLSPFAPPQRSLVSAEMHREILHSLPLLCPILLLPSSWVCNNVFWHCACWALISGRIQSDKGHVVQQTSCTQNEEFCPLTPTLRNIFSYPLCDSQRMHECHELFLLR